MAKKGQTITRYSHNPLAKKFKCPQCGNWFRTLQGLSGHVRFKHGEYDKKESVVDRLIEIEEKKVRLAAWGQGLGLSTATIEARQQILTDWARLLEYCRSFDVNLSDEDFKSYVIRSYHPQSR